MSETVTLEIHRTPPNDDNPRYVLAKRIGYGVGSWHVDTVRLAFKDFEWWHEIPAPVKPRRFVVSEYKAFGTTCWKVMDSIEKANNAIRIPNPEAAQAIADIYEENQ